MNLIHIRCVLVSFLILGAASPRETGKKPTKQSAAPPTSEQIEVYRAFLSQYRCGEFLGCEKYRNYLINVTSAYMPAKAEIDPRCPQSLRDKEACCLHGIALEERPTVVRSHAIPSSAVKGLKISLVTEKRARLTMGEGWHQIFFLSEVAFSQDHPFAVLYYSVGSTSGYTAILVSADGSWRFDQLRSSCMTGVVE